MIYRNFAIGTLIAAPLVVLAVQSMVPKAPEPAPSQPIIADAPPPVLVPVAPPVAPPAPAVDMPAFGQPMAEAGKPMLAPGAGLPEAPETRAAPTVATGQMFTPDAAPAESPNAQ